METQSMSSSPAIDESRTISGQKMRFSQTCNLLSQYVKERRGLPNKNNLDATEEEAAAEATEESNSCVGKTINLFPQLSASNSSVNKCTSPEPPAPQMTIFYGGQVLVFNDLPADKAKEVMELATTIEAGLRKRKVEATDSTSLIPPVAIPVSAQNYVLTQNSNQSLNVAPTFLNNGVPPVLPNPSDLPIARKASLHRFLQKRKDRLVGKVTSEVANGGSSKPAEGKAWLGLNSLPAFHMEKQQPS